MATLNEVRSRIQGIQNTQKITKAMKIVSATKLKRAERAQRLGKNFSREVEVILHEIACFAHDVKDPFLVPKRHPHHAGFLIVSSERGLCGAFNATLLKRAHERIEEVRVQGLEPVLYVLGQKGMKYFAKYPYTISFTRAFQARQDRLLLVQELVAKIEQDYLAGRIDSLEILTTEYRSSANFSFTAKRFLPVRLEEVKKTDVDYIYEPSYPAVLGRLLPLYMQYVVLQALMESNAAEEASRMLAMDHATENAETLVGELTLFYNRSRQAVITKEISEIVGGAEALAEA